MDEAQEALIEKIAGRVYDRAEKRLREYIQEQIKAHKDGCPFTVDAARVVGGWKVICILALIVNAALTLYCLWPKKG